MLNRLALAANIFGILGALFWLVAAVSADTSEKEHLEGVGLSCSYILILSLNIIVLRRQKMFPTRRDLVIVLLMVALNSIPMCIAIFFWVQHSRLTLALMPSPEVLCCILVGSATVTALLFR
jgi:hypothetical protein